ncbi:MAG: beta-galactosidase GalB [Akkermansia sp.]
MKFPLSRLTLCLTALTVSQAFAAPLSSSQRETFDFGWKFARFGNMPDGTSIPEPGSATGAIKADSQQAENPAANAIDGDISTRWCAQDAKEGHSLILDMGKAVDAKKIKIDWESQGNHFFKLEGSADNKRWITIADKTHEENNSAQDIVTVQGKPRFLKLTIMGTNNGNWASVRELSVLDTQEAPIKPILSESKQAEDIKSPLYNDTQWRSLDLPHDWGIEGPFRMDLPNETGKLPWDGIGWYRKSLEVPASAKGNQFYLDFDGVMSRPKIYVNGELAGEWKYGYASFRVDITPFLKFGEKNTIAVRVDNPPNSSRWYPGGGIYRHVWLTEANPVHIDNWGVYIRTPEVSKERAIVDIDTSILNTSDQTITPTVIEEIMTSPQDTKSQGVVVAKKETKGTPITAGQKGVVASKITVPSPQLWDTDKPNMYAVRTTIQVDGKTIDTKITDFGIRSIEWKPEGFFLNGRRVQLNGVCQHADLGPLGTAVHSRGYERQIQILKEFGVNAIRTTHNPPAPEMLELCDRNGILVLAELFDMWKMAKKGQDYHNSFPEWHEKDLVNFCHRDRNHPSIIIWSTGNEVPEQGNKANHYISQELTNLFKREDPSRLVTVGCSDEGAARNGFADTMDVYGYNYKPWAYNNFSKDRPKQPFYASETSSCVSSRGEYYFPVNWDKSKGFYEFQVSSYDLYAPGWAYRPDIEFAAQEDSPNCAGEFVWTGFDYLGEPTPYNQDGTNALNFRDPAERAKYMEELKKLGNRAPSRSSYFGIVDLCGFKKDRFYIYQAQWKPDQPMAHILPHWNWEERKGEKIPVHVYTNGDQAELFLNGKSLGVRQKGKKDDDRFRLVWNDVTYQPGELKVIVKKENKPWTHATVKTTGKASNLTLTPDRKTITGDGRDLSYVTISVRDSKGNIVPRSKNKLSFKVTGPADIVGIGNGDATDFTTMANPDKAPVMILNAYNGLAQVILRSKRGKQGKVTLQAVSPGLTGQKTTITVTPATPEQMKK